MTSFLISSSFPPHTHTRQRHSYKEDAILSPDESITGLVKKRQKVAPSGGENASVMGARGRDEGGNRNGGVDDRKAVERQHGEVVDSAAGISVNYISNLQGIADDGSSLLDAPLMRAARAT